MSKLMLIVGILLAAIGIALGLMVFFSPGQMQVYGLTAEVAALFLVGGVLAMGLGGVIDGLHASGAAPRAAAPAPPEPETAAPVVAATTTAAVAATEPELSPAVSETIRALEKAKTDLQTAFDEKPKAIEPEPEPEPEAAPEPEEVEAVEEEPVAEDEGQLYVLEEKTIRGRPARILSDGTVEAETSEGWMRFENLEHLDEYLDAMEPQA